MPVLFWDFVVSVLFGGIYHVSFQDPSKEIIRRLVETVTPVLPLAKVARHGWISTRTAQVWDAAVAEAYHSRGQEIHNLWDLQAQGPPKVFTPLHLGNAYGYLQMFPNVSADGIVTSPLKPLDIAVFDQLPLDLGVVQGTMSTVFQTVNSHINLKSNEVCSRSRHQVLVKRFTLVALHREILPT